jgi:hypothetical protein
MTRNVLIIGVVLILLLSACAPKAAPTANPVDIQHTAEAGAFTMVAETQAAVPTSTLVPPTDTPVPTTPTNTPPPLPTSATQATAGAALPTPAGIPTFTPQSPNTTTNTDTNNQDVCNQPLTAWQGPTANFAIANQTRPRGTIVLSMYVVTTMGQCGYLVITGDSFSGPIGQYSAGAFITGKQNFKAFGGFNITEGNWKIVVKNDSITALGGCYPNC